MGTIGPLNRWVGSSAVVLTKQAATSNNWSIAALKHAALGAVIGNTVKWRCLDLGWKSYSIENLNFVSKNNPVFLKITQYF